MTTHVRIACVGLALLTLSGCAVWEPLGGMHGQLGGADLRVGLSRRENFVKADTEVRGGWANRVILYDPFGVQYLPVSVESKKRDSGPRLSVGFGTAFGRGDSGHASSDCGSGSGEGGVRTGMGVSIPLPAGKRPDEKTFLFELPSEDSPECGGWAISCEVTGKDGKKVEIPFDVPKSDECDEDLTWELPPDESIEVSGKEECEFCPHTSACVAIFVISEPGDPAHKQFAKLTDAERDAKLKAEMETLMYWTNTHYNKICIRFEICGIYRLDPRQARVPGGGDHTLSEYRRRDGKYEAHKIRFNGRDFLHAAAEIVDDADLECPLKNPSCLKLFIVEKLNGDGIGQYEIGACVPISEARTPGIPGQIPGHEFGHDLFGVVPDKTDGNGHTPKDGKNMMSEVLGFGAVRLRGWQETRAKAAIERRGLEVPGSKEAAIKKCKELTAQIAALEKQIALAEAAAKKAEEAARKAEEAKGKGKKPRRGPKREKRTLDQQIAEYDSRVERYKTARDGAPNEKNAATWEGMRKDAADHLEKLKKKKAAEGGSPPAGGDAAPKGDALPKDFDLEEAQDRLEKLKEERDRYCTCREEDA